MRPDLVVVGAGVMGLWTGLRALETGRRVTIVDAFGVGDPRGTSNDRSRITRAAHGSDALYARWSRDALRAWIELGEEAGERTFVKTGVTWFAHRPDGFEAAAEATLRSLDVPTERLDPDEITRRWPAIDATDLEFGLYEPEAGVLRAAAAMDAAAATFERRGGDLRVERVRPGAVSGDRLLDLRSDAGKAIGADAFVFAAGPWLPGLFPDVIGDRISVTKQDVVHLGPASGDLRFDADRFPTWIDFDEAIYAVPALDGHGPKIPPDAYGRPFDPDTDDRVVDASSIETVRRYLAKRVPDLADRPVVESRVCQYEATADTHFILDRHPRLENVWLAGGGSGHAFKQGPEIGRYVAALVDGRTPPNAPPDNRFSLTRDRRSGAGVRAGSDSPRPVPVGS